MPTSKSAAGRAKYYPGRSSESETYSSGNAFAAAARTLERSNDSSTTANAMIAAASSLPRQPVLGMLRKPHNSKPFPHPRLRSANLRTAASNRLSVRQTFPVFPGPASGLRAQAEQSTATSTSSASFSQFLIHTTHSRLQETPLRRRQSTLLSRRFPGNTKPSLIDKSSKRHRIFYTGCTNT